MGPRQWREGAANTFNNIERVYSRAIAFSNRRCSVPLESAEIGTRGILNALSRLTWTQSPLFPSPSFLFSSFVFSLPFASPPPPPPASSPTPRSPPSPPPHPFRPTSPKPFPCPTKSIPTHLPQFNSLATLLSPISISCRAKGPPIATVSLHCIRLQYHIDTFINR